MTAEYEDEEPSCAQIDALTGPAVIEFGTPWCGYCRAAQPLIAAAFADHPHVRHIRIENGKGRPLGRSIGVTLWPTLIFLRDGKESTRLVRPADSSAVKDALRTNRAGVMGDGSDGRRRQNSDAALVKC